MAMGDATLDPRFALDLQGVDALRRTARTAPQEGLRQVSRQFEALFVHMLIKSMRASVPQGGGPFDSQSQRLYTELLDQQWAQSLSGRGVGLADAMLAALQRQVDPGAAPAREGGTRRAALGAYRANAGAGEASAAVDPASPGSHVERFAGRMGASALRASAATGVPAPLILAQAALESGWGRREAVGEDGVRSHNLFGIKADKGWRGPSVEAWTTEYVDGVPQRVRARFRAYGSYEEAFTDYARFLTRNPRYADVLDTDDAAEAAHGLQRAGYATDPDYGRKLVRIMQQLG